MPRSVEIAAYLKIVYNLARYPARIALALRGCSRVGGDERHPEHLAVRIKMQRAIQQLSPVRSSSLMETLVPAYFNRRVIKMY